MKDVNINVAKVLMSLLMTTITQGLWMPGANAHPLSDYRLTSDVNVTDASDLVLQEQYNQGVLDAAIPVPGENVSTLTAITAESDRLIWNEDESRLLVVTWKNQRSYDTFIAPNTRTSASEAHVIWVTAAPEIQEFCHRYLAEHPNATAAELDLRLKQHLGLHYDWNYDVFVELWVSPEDLFRPCVDPDITDMQCGRQFGDSYPHVRNIEDYRAFYNNLYAQSFRGTPGVPWTGLGYTYDWGSPVTEVGASEFIVVPDAAYTIHNVQATQTYCSVLD